MSKKRWIVTLSLEFPMEVVANEIARAGFEIEEQLVVLRCVSGRADIKTAGEVSKIPGVETIDEDTGTYALGVVQ